ncbi:hypothetical protein [Methyloversatilis thermotolerans]|uniref:hypothetical protein n=1 Tax=Methyloversatilis thermotolerans TaxID=1346290 RepID=UPI00036E261D|nr:hypothetical protein [Methyloversatilis thermotolerans]
MSDLLLKFLSEEATPHVRKLILDAVDEHSGLKQRDRCRFEFNRFEVTLDFVNDMAKLEDVLDPELSGEFRLRLGEFVHRLSEDS